MSTSKSIHCLSSIEAVFKLMTVKKKLFFEQIESESLSGTNSLQQWNDPRVELGSGEGFR